MAVECCVRSKSERGSASNPVVQMSSYIHTYIHTLLMLPKWAFQLNRIKKIQICSSSAGRIFPQSLVPRLSLPPSPPQQ